MLRCRVPGDKGGAGGPLRPYSGGLTNRVFGHRSGCGILQARVFVQQYGTVVWCDGLLQDKAKAGILNCVTINSLYGGLRWVCLIVPFLSCFPKVDFTVFL